MNIPNEMELKQEYIDIVHEIEETIWSKIEKYKAEHPEKFKHGIRLRKIEK